MKARKRAGDASYTSDKTKMGRGKRLRKLNQLFSDSSDENLSDEKQKPNQVRTLEGKQSTSKPSGNKKQTNAKTDSKNDSELTSGEENNESNDPATKEDEQGIIIINIIYLSM